MKRLNLDPRSSQTRAKQVVRMGENRESADTRDLLIRMAGAAINAGQMEDGQGTPPVVKDPRLANVRWLSTHIGEPPEQMEAFVLIELSGEELEGDPIIDVIGGCLSDAAGPGYWWFDVCHMVRAAHPEETAADALRMVETIYAGMSPR